jgi:hypothetical protein
MVFPLIFLISLTAVFPALAAAPPPPQPEQSQRHGEQPPVEQIQRQPNVELGEPPVLEENSPPIVFYDAFHTGQQDARTHQAPRPKSAFEDAAAWRRYAVGRSQPSLTLPPGTHFLEENGRTIAVLPQSQHALESSWEQPAVNQLHRDYGRPYNPPPLSDSQWPPPYSGPPPSSSPALPMGSIAFREDDHVVNVYVYDSRNIGYDQEKVTARFPKDKTQPFYLGVYQPGEPDIRLLQWDPQIGDYMPRGRIVRGFIDPLPPR